MTSQPAYENFVAHFGDRAVPEELTALWEFDLNEGAGRDYYADGFELDTIPKAALGSWSEDPEFLDGVIGFALANGSGSTYGFWVAEGHSLAECPIVAFGDEGGTQVVAENLRALLRLLSYDAELTIDFDDAYFYREDGDEHSERHDEYVSWLRDRVQLEPVSDPDSLVSAAREQHQERFAAWVERFTS